MSETVSELLNLQGKIVSNQLEMRKVQEEHQIIISKLSTVIDNIEERIKDQGDILSSNTKVFEKFTEATKEFSYYASNRELHDQQLAQSMDLLSKMWDQSINLFNESKRVLDAIYKFSANLQTENLAIMKSIDSAKYPGMNLLQERFNNGLIEIIAKLTRGISIARIEKFIKEWVSSSIVEKGRTNLPQYQEKEERHKIYRKFIIMAAKEFEMTEFGVLIADFFHLMFICFTEGENIVETNNFGKYLGDFAEYENEIFEEIVEEQE